MLKLVFNGLAILVASISIWKMLSMTAKMQEEKALISKILHEKDTLVQEKAVFSKEHATRYSRERVKNQKLEEENFQASMEESNQQKARDTSSSLIADLENSISQSEKSIENLKLQLIKDQKDFEELDRVHKANIATIPSLRLNKNNVLNSIQNLEDEIRMLKSSLENYEAVTKRLKEHYDHTIASLFRDKTSRNWLEAGEFIRVSYIKVDLNNGLLGLPVGQEDGVHKDKLFAIRSNGGEICKIKITHSGLNHAVASIIPLLGKPAKLLNLSEFDLYHL